MPEEQTSRDSLAPSLLSPEAQRIYETLVTEGALKARELSLKTPYSRPHVYKLLEELHEQGLVEKHEQKGAVTTFSAQHPQHLIELAERRKSEAEVTYRATVAAAESLVSAFNLTAGKPGVRFFEGLEGVRQVLADALTATETIYTYADLEAIDRHIKNINQEHFREREKRGVKKRGIVPDSEFAREFLREYDPEITDTRVIRHPERIPFHVVMQMYDSTTSYITLAQGSIISVLIEDPHITDMHRYLFEVLWEKAADPVDLYGAN